MKLKVTNIAARNFGVNASEGTVFLDPNETYEGDFDDNEAVALNRLTDTFKVEGFKEPAGGGDAPKAGGDAAKQIADLTKKVADLTKENADLKSQLSAASGKSTVTLEDAVAGLDHKNDEHWNKDGTPSVKYLETVTGNKAINADDVKAFGVKRKQ